MPVNTDSHLYTADSPRERNSEPITYVDIDVPKYCISLNNPVSGMQRQIIKICRFPVGYKGCPILPASVGLRSIARNSFILAEVKAE